MVRRFNISDSEMGTWLMEHLSLSRLDDFISSAKEQFGSLKKVTMLIKNPENASKDELEKLAALLNTEPSFLFERFGVGKLNVIILERESSMNQVSV